ncbi:stress response translation initiation inhibitor YciH [Ideonella sp. DXS22W]|uniref:Stress response translation initiation inhibitor YciH n=1 Tax=Pseudaquabacterium inlustre TaxID=2984192 RepID=A0ABU9CGT7_9BURK
MPSMKLKSAGTGGLVYSTDAGSMCPACRQPLAACTCAAQAAAAALRGDGTVRVHFETKGRGGKAVTVVRGLDDLPPDTLAQWGKQLRTACGAGGAVKDGGVLEIQGDHREKVQAWLQAQGRKVKLAGG